MSTHPKEDIYRIVVVSLNSQAILNLSFVSVRKCCLTSITHENQETNWMQ